MAFSGNATAGYAIASSAVETIHNGVTYSSAASKTIAFGSGTSANPTTVTNNGTVTNTSFTGIAMGDLASTYGKIVNNGTISSKNTTIALSDDANIINNGTISTTTNMSYTILAGRNSAINNEASGVISTNSDYAIKFSAGASITNRGVINGGIDIFSATGEGGVISNSGTINGPLWDSDGNLTVVLSGGSMGAVTAGGGGDWISVTGAATIGATDGGTGNDTFTINPGAGKILTLRGAVSNFETLTVKSGQLQTSGYGLDASWLTVENGASLTGGGALAGTITFDAGSTLYAGANMTYSVTGTVTLNGALSLVNGGTTGQTITLINNDDNDAVAGGFSNITAGTEFAIGDYIYTLSYTGGTGNDVVLTVVYAPPPPAPPNPANPPTQSNSGSGDPPITTYSAGQVHKAHYGDSNDQLGLGDADDLIYGMGGSDLIQGSNGNDTLFGNWDNDTLAGSNGFDILFGGKQDDLLSGDDNADVLSGNRDNDTLNGGTGNDTLYGGQEDDQLYGNDDADILWGDLGNDTLTGGTGADRFEFAARSGQDVITDFSGLAGDRISLNGQTILQTTDTNDGAVLSLSGGGTIVLQGLAAAGIEAGWFL